MDDCYSKGNQQIYIGKKIVLRPLDESDTELIVNWRNSSFVRNHFIFREDLTKDKHKKWIEEEIKSGRVVQYIIEKKESRKPIGSVYLRDINRKYLSAEYGIFIGEAEEKNKGFGTEAATIVLQIAFNSLGLHRVFLRVFQDNIRAIKSYEKAGFILEGVARDMVFIDGHFRNIVFMSAINPNH